MASKGSEAMVSNEMGDLDGDSLVMHRTGRPGKIEVVATKPLATQRDLSLAYTPGVAKPRHLHRLYTEIHLAHAARP